MNKGLILSKRKTEYDKISDSRNGSVAAVLFFGGTMPHSIAFRK